MAKIGDVTSVTLNGTRYAVPKDIEPTINEGGEVITETQEFGDGTADSYVSKTIAKITGLRVKLDDDNRDAFKTARSTPDIPVVLNCIGKSYELTGSIVGDFGKSATKRLSEEFEVHCTDGTGIRES